MSVSFGTPGFYPGSAGAFKPANLEVPQFNDHDLPGSRDSAIRARNQALSGYNLTSEAFSVASKAQDVLGRAQLFINENNLLKQAAAKGV